MKPAGVSPRMADLEAWWLYLDHGSFFSGWRRTRGTGALPGQVEDEQGRARASRCRNYTGGCLFFPPYRTHLVLVLM